MTDSANHSVTALFVVQCKTRNLYWVISDIDVVQLDEFDPVLEYAARLLVKYLCDNDVLTTIEYMDLEAARNRVDVIVMDTDNQLTEEQMRMHTNMFIALVLNETNCEITADSWESFRARACIRSAEQQGSLLPASHTLH